MATIMKWKIDPTIGTISPKIKALASTVEILWPYLYFLVMATIIQYGNHDQMNYIPKIWDIPNDNYLYQWTWPLWSASDIVNIFLPPQKSLLHNAHYHKCGRLLVHAHVCTQVNMDKEVCTHSLRTKQDLNNPAITVLTIIAKKL